MERRTLLKPMKKTEPKKEEEPQINDFKEEEVFVKKKKEEEPPEIIEPEVEHEIEIDEIAPEIKEVMEKEIVLEQKKKRKKRVLTDAMKENLKRMNQKSAEVRKQRSEAKREEEARLKKEIEDEKEEKMKLKVRKEMEMEKNKPLPSVPIDIPPPSLPAKERGVHVPQQVSGVKDVHHGVENYDRLIEGVMGALRSDKYITQLERDIRTDERRKTEVEYKEKLDKYEKEQHKKHQREVGFSLLQGQPMRRNNSTFSRTQILKDRWGKR